MPVITVHNREEIRKIHTLPEETVHQALVRMGIFHHAPCGGQKLCHNCKMVMRGEFLPPKNQETEFLTDEELLKGVRFACMAIPAGQCDVYLDMTVFQQPSPGEADLSHLAKAESGYSCGIDIGTTTVAVYLYDKATATQVDALSRLNEQATYGADVISRIEAARSPSVRTALQQTISNQLGQMIETLCRNNHIPYGDITDCVIAANTTMLHLLTGIDPSGIAIAPFTPHSLFGTVYRGDQLGLPLTCEVFLLPCVSAYVGGDITAGMVACDMDKADKTLLLIDVGTNGEMALCKKNTSTIYCLSTAAGPAFEGAHITHGVGGIPGAIYKVDHNRIYTIENKPAVGICGSGLLDSIALLLDQEVLDETGYLEEDYVLDPAASIVITPRDIREVQLAKSAICSGVIRLMELADVTPEEIDGVLFAGGFGAHINPESAVKVGLIPRSLKGKCSPVGNTAGLGAVMASLSQDYRMRMEQLPDFVQYFELSGDLRFNQLFVENMMFEE